MGRGLRRVEEDSAGEVWDRGGVTMRVTINVRGGLTMRSRVGAR